jgi:hypothetical protein
VSDSDATLTGQPSGKTLKIYVIAANDAGQAAPSDTVTIVVPCGVGRAVLCPPNDMVGRRCCAAGLADPQVSPTLSALCQC